MIIRRLDTFKFKLLKPKEKLEKERKIAGFWGGKNDKKKSQFRH